jgi:hypothetical protein
MSFSFHTAVARREVLCYGVVCTSEVIYSFPDFFFAIFAAIGLKFGLLNCSSSSCFGVVESFVQELRLELG